MPNSSGSRKSQHMGCSSDDASAALVRQEALTRSPQNQREDAVPLLCCQAHPASCMPGYFPHSDMCKFTQHPRDVLPFPPSRVSLLLSQVAWWPTGQNSSFFWRAGELVAVTDGQDRKLWTAFEQLMSPGQLPGLTL